MIAGENSLFTQIRCRHGEKLKTVTIYQSVYIIWSHDWNVSTPCQRASL